MTRDYRTSPMRHGLAVSHAFHARQADPATHSALTDNPRNNTAQPRHNPALTRARARPTSRARTLPTNRREGGSLT